MYAVLTAHIDVCTATNVLHITSQEDKIHDGVHA
jgi:hypothetical protein